MTAAAASPAHPLAVPAFRRFLGGAFVAVPGQWMVLTAQAWILLNLTGSALAMAWLATLQFLPTTLLTLIGGAVADRFPKRRLMLMTQATAAALALAMAGAEAAGLTRVWLVYAFALAMGTVSALDVPLRQAFVAELVPRPLVPKAIALAVTVQNLGRILGSALGGMVIAWAGVPAALSLGAASFLCFLAALATLKVSARGAGLVRKPILAEVRAGFAFAAARPILGFLLIAAFFIGLFGQNFTTMVPLVAGLVVRAGASEFGLFNAALGAGSLLAALAMAARSTPSIPRVIGAGLGFAVALVAVSLTDRLGPACLFFGLAGAAAVAFSTTVSAAVQLSAPPEMRGRLAAMIYLLIAGTSPVGALLTGAVAEMAGVPVAVALNGVLCAVGITVAVAFLLHHRRRGPVRIGVEAS